MTVQQKCDKIANADTTKILCMVKFDINWKIKSK